MRSCRTDITLNNVLTILDEHYNNIKALDALNQELFQLQMGKRRLCQTGAFDCQGIFVLVASLPECFLPDCMAQLKHDCFHGRLPKHFKAMVAYLKASPQEKTYSNYLEAMREAKMEDSMEPSQSHTIDNTAKHKLTSFFPLWKLKGTQPAVKMATVCLAHVEEESANRDEGVDSEDPEGIEGVTEEFMVHLVRAMKVAQKEEKCCYHCSSLDHFICDSPLVKALRMNSHLNHKEGMAPKKGAWAPQKKVTMPTTLLEGVPKA